MQMCSETPDAALFLWYNLWPSTIHEPCTAIDISLMELIYSMVLESHISLMRACKAIKVFASMHYKITDEKVHKHNMVYTFV